MGNAHPLWVVQREHNHGGIGYAFAVPRPALIRLRALFVSNHQGGPSISQPFFTCWCTGQAVQLHSSA